MYEAHFGLSGPPFQLNPDPAFYFDSRGHSNALAYLRFGVYQGEGFIVVTGEIGAGKTTLVRALLEGLDADRIVAAQVVSTQLESGDLLRSIVTAFGIPAAGTGKAQLLATLESFLTALAAKKRRALLVIDEAQNLGRDAIEELRMLSNFQLGNHALLQSFLIGQPELRRLIESPSMEQLRQRVIASCHLGPLDAAETRQYIEHRLHHVGWKGRPHFEPGAFAAVHRWTDGIPRRVNLLCNRLMLAAFLANQATLDGEAVERTARELRSETGDSAVTPPLSPAVSPVSAVAAPAAAPAPAPAAGTAPRGTPLRAGELGTQARLRITDEGVTRQSSHALPKGGGSLVFLMDTRLDALKCAVLAQACAALPQLPPAVFVNPGCRAALAHDAGLDAALPPPAETIHLGVADGAPADVHAAVTLRFDAVLDELKPVAVLAAGEGDGVLACALLARRRGVPLLRLEGGMRVLEQRPARQLQGQLLDRLADVVYTSRMSAHYSLFREGIAADSVICIGEALQALLRTLVPLVPAGSDTLARLGVPRPWRKQASQGYVLVSAQLGDDDLPAADLRDFAAALRAMGQGRPLLWPLQERTLRELHTQGLERSLGEVYVALVPPVGYLQQLGLLRDAHGVIAGPAGAQADEAACMNVRTLMLTRRAGAPIKVDELLLTLAGLDTDAAVRELDRTVADAARLRQHAPLRDVEAGARLAEHLLAWLPEHSRRRRHIDHTEAAA